MPAPVSVNATPEQSGAACQVYRWFAVSSTAEAAARLRYQSSSLGSPSMLARNRTPSEPHQAMSWLLPLIGRSPPGDKAGFGLTGVAGRVPVTSTTYSSKTSSVSSWVKKRMCEPPGEKLACRTLVEEGKGV